MVIRNTLINIAGRVVTAAMGFVLTAALVRHLGQTNYGVLMLALAVAGNTTFLEGVFGVGITRNVAYLQGVGDRPGCNRTISTGLFVSLLQGFLVGLLVVGSILFFFPMLFGHLDVASMRNLRLLLCVLLLKFLIQVCSTSLMRVLEGYQQFRALRAVDIVFSLVSLGTLVAFVAFFPNVPLWWIGWLYVALEIGRLIFVWTMLRIEGISIEFGMGDRETFWRLFEFGRPLLVAKGMTFLAYRSDALLIGIFLTAEAVAQYQVASQVQAVGVTVISLLTSALLPVLSQRAGQGTEVLVDLFLRASRYVVYGAMSVACIVVLVRSPLFAVWLGEGFAKAQWLTCLLMVQFVCAQHQGVSGLMLVSTNQHHPLAWVEALGSALQVVLALILIRRLGVYGVVVAGIAKSLMMTVLYCRLALRTFGLGLRTFVLESLSSSWLVVCSAVIFLVGFQMGAGFGESHVIAVVQAAITACALLILSWYVISEARDRKNILRVLTAA